MKIGKRYSLGQSPKIAAHAVELEESSLAGRSHVSERVILEHAQLDDVDKIISAPFVPLGPLAN